MKHISFIDRPPMYFFFLTSRKTSFEAEKKNYASGNTIDPKNTAEITYK
jgi:hypothetical protein